MDYTEPLVLYCPVGDKTIKVEVSRPWASKSPYYAVNIDGFYNGKLFKRDERWRAHLNVRSELQIDDIQLIGDILETKTPGQIALV